MSKELQSIQRNVLEKSASLPKNTAFSQIQQSFNTLSNLSAHAAEKVAVEHAQQAGQTQAFETEGAPKKLAPGLTSATRAYNNAFLETQATVVISNANNALSQTRQDFEQSRLNSDSISQYNQVAKGIIQGTLEGVNPEVRAAVGIGLNKAWMQNLDKLSDSVSRFNEREITAATNLAISDSLNEVRAAILAGDKSALKRAGEDFDRARQNAKILRDTTEADLTRIDREFKRTIINSDLEKGYHLAMVEGGEDEAAQFVSKFINQNQKDLSLVEKENAKSFLLNLHNQTSKELNTLSRQGYENILSEFFDEQSPIKTRDDLNAAIQRQAEKGLSINLAQKNDLVQRLHKSNSKAAQRQETNRQIFSSIQNKDIGIVDFSSADLNNFFFDAVSSQIARRDADAASGDIRAQQTKDWQIEAQVASITPVEIPAFTKRLNARLTSSNLEDVDTAIRQYGFLRDNNEDALTGLTDEVDAFADTLLTDINNSSASRDLKEVIAENKEAILNADEGVKERRLRNHKDITRRSPTSSDNNIRKAFNLKSGLFGRDDIPDDLRDTYDKLLSKNAQLYETTDYNLAVDKTIRQLKEIYKDSPEFGPKGRPVPNPVESLPFFGFGKIVENQAAGLIDEIAQSQSQFDDLLPYKIRPSKKMKPIPENLTDDKKFSDNFAEQGYWLEINGVDMPVYFISPNFRKMEPFAPNVYQVYIGWMGEDGKSEERLRPLTTVRPQQNATNRPQTTMSTFFPPSIYIPEFVQKLSEEQDFQAFQTAAEEKILKDNPIRLKDFQFPQRPGSAKKSIADLKSEIQARNDLIAKQKQFLAREIQDSLEAERRRRQDDNLDEQGLP